MWAEDRKDFRNVENYMGSKIINHIHNKLQYISGILNCQNRIILSFVYGHIEEIPYKPGSYYSWGHIIGITLSKWKQSTWLLIKCLGCQN